MKPNFTWVIYILLGLILVVIPLATDSYDHYQQDKVFREAYSSNLSCRISVAAKQWDHSRRTLDAFCGSVPSFEDFEVRSNRNVFSSVFRMVSDRVTVLPL